MTSSVGHLEMTFGDAEEVDTTQGNLPTTVTKTCSRCVVSARTVRIAQQCGQAPRRITTWAAHTRMERDDFPHRPATPAPAGSYFADHGRHGPVGRLRDRARDDRGAGAAAAAPPRIVYNTKVDDQQVTLTVYSRIDGQEHPGHRPGAAQRNQPSPTLYLLGGAGGAGRRAMGPEDQIRYKRYFAKENVYVVTPIGGAFSYYTDWQKDDPSSAATNGLPSDQGTPRSSRSTFNTSRSGASPASRWRVPPVLGLAIAAPVYRAVAGFSGCARTSDPLGRGTSRPSSDSAATPT